MYCYYESENVSHSVMSDSATPWIVVHRLLCPWYFSGKNTSREVKAQFTLVKEGNIKILKTVKEIQSSLGIYGFHVHRYRGKSDCIAPLFIKDLSICEFMGFHRVGYDWSDLAAAAAAAAEIPGGFLGGSDGKESVCNARDLGSNPQLGRSTGEGNGNPSSILPGESYGQGSLVGLQSMGLQLIPHRSQGTAVCFLNFLIHQ